MSRRLDAATQARLLSALGSLLEQARQQRRTLGYLEVADLLAVPGPHRIHKTTRLIEILLKQEIEQGITPRTAVIVSRTGTGRPAAGYFDRAQRLGLFDGVNPEAFHDGLLEELFKTRGP
ncbi:MAG: hypothetical protein AAGJ52_06240 [Pseudomonadota bacterium]